MAMGVAVLISVATALGTFIPLVAGGPAQVFQAKGVMVILSVVTLLAGVVLIALAGKKRAASQIAETESRKVCSFRSGLTICIFSGIFSSMFNLAFAFSGPVSKAATQTGADKASALNMVWMVTLIGGFIPTGLYTGYLLTRNRTWNNYGLPRTSLYWVYGILMAVTWTGGVILYGRGASAMGSLGAAIGFPLAMAALIIGSSVVGFVTGEWKSSSSQAKRLMAGGLGLLMMAAALIGIANRL
jgi:L-rhamnose-H+ transport protein